MTLTNDATAELCAISYKDGCKQGRQEVIDIITDMHKRGIIQDHTFFKFLDNLSALKGEDL